MGSCSHPNCSTIHCAETLYRPGSVFDESSIDSVCLAYWDYRRLGALPDSNITKRLLTLVATQTLINIDFPRAAVLYCALREAVSQVLDSECEQNWQIGRAERSAETIVISICRKFHIFAQQLLVRYDGRHAVAIRDEYDVQDLMHALLKLHFSDVRAEEVAPSVGGKVGPRMDFLLKGETNCCRNENDPKGT